MDPKEKLEQLHKEALEKFEEYLKLKGQLSEDQHEKIHEAKKEWQSSWAKLMDVLIVLERLEI